MYNLLIPVVHRHLAMRLPVILATVLLIVPWRGWAADPTLADGLDIPGSTVSTQGDSPWTVVTTPTRDGFDAVCAGDVTTGQVSDLALVVEGPSEVRWWSKGSQLLLFLDDQRTVAGSVVSVAGWQQSSLMIPPGAHRIIWRRDWRYAPLPLYLDQVQVLPQTAGTIGCASSTMAVIEGQAGVQEVSVWISRSGGCAGPATAAYTVTAGGATLGADAVVPQASGVLSWADGVGGSQTVRVEVIGDTVPEADETLTLTVQGISAGATLGQASTAVVIVDDDGAAMAALPAAIGCPGTAVSLAGDAAWQAVAAPAHDDIDAARSGGIGHGQASDLAISVTGPVELSWWWMVSSEAGHDLLSALCDGYTALAPAISGSVGWTRCTASIPAGTHTVTWRYRKDAALSAGLDAGFIDGVEIAGGAPGRISLASGSLSGVEIASGWHPVTATVERTEGWHGPVGVTYGTRPASALAGVHFVPAQGQLAWADGDQSPRQIVIGILPDGVVADGRMFSLELSDPTGGASLGTATAAITITDPEALAVAVGLAGQRVAVDGAGGWSVTEDRAHAGTSAVRLGGIGTEQTTSFHLLDVEGPATVSWWWAISAASGDECRCSVDGGWGAYIFSDSDWTRSTVRLPAGSHRIAWTFERWVHAPAGADAAFIDQVEIDRTGSGTVELSGPVEVREGDAGIATAEVVVRRVGGNSGALSVAYAVEPAASGWRVAADDYLPDTGTLTWADGDASDRIIPVHVIGDGVAENDEGIQIVVRATADAGAGILDTWWIAVANDDAGPDSLADAIDQPGLPVVVMGQGRCVAVAVPAIDAEDALRLTAEDYENPVAFAIDVEGPALVGWWWLGRNSPIFPHDWLLTVELDGIAQSLFARSSWERASLAVPAGRHRLSWRLRWLTLSMAADPAVAYVDQVTIDRTANGTLGFTTSTGEAVEGGAPAVAVVERSDGRQGAVSVTYRTIAGTARAGVDFTPVSGQFTWADGDDSPRQITIPVLDNQTVDGTREFSLLLSDPSGGAGLARVLQTIRIHDDDGAIGALSEAIDQPTLPVATSGSTPWVALGAAAEGNLDAAASGPIGDDGVSDLSIRVEGPVQVGWWWRVSSEAGRDTLRALIDGSDAVPAISGETAWEQHALRLGSGSHLVTWRYSKDFYDSGPIGDDRGFVDRVSIQPLTPGGFAVSPLAATVDEGAGGIELRVDRVGGDWGAASVDYATVDGTARAGSDYLGMSGSLVWADGDASPRFVTVGILDDDVVETDEHFRFQLGTASGAAVLGSASAATVVIRSDDLAPTGTISLQQTSCSSQEGDEGERQVVVTVVRTGGSRGTASVGYTTADGTAHEGSDYLTGQGILTWGDGDAEAKSATLSIRGDRTDEPDEWFWMRLGPATGAALGSASVAVVSIRDDDPAPAGQLAFVLPASAVTETDGEHTVEVQVERAGGSAGAVTVGCALVSSGGMAMPGADFRLPSTRLVWADGEMTVKSFPVIIMGDRIWEGDESFTMRLDGFTGGASPGQDCCVVTIVDDDQDRAGRRIAFRVTRADEEGVGGVSIHRAPVEPNGEEQRLCTRADGYSDEDGDRPAGMEPFYFASSTADQDQIFTFDLLPDGDG